MQRYISGIQQRYLKDPEYAALPVVLPILISNARRRWPYALDLHSAYPGELEAFPEIWPHVAQLRIILDDLPATSIEELLDRQLTDMAVVALCMLRDALVFKRLNRAIPLWIPRLRRVREQDREDYNTLVEYLGSATRPEQIDALRVTIRQEAPDMAQEIVSTLDHYMAKGRAEGRVEGRAEGRAEILQRQLTLKFGQLPEWALQRLQSSSVEQLDSYADRILTAESLEETLKA